MNISSPKKISLLLAAVISLLTALILVFDLYFVNQAHWLFIVLSLLLIFGITYYLLNTVIINFIFSKIKPIYRTVDHLHIADDELYDKIENNQYVSEIESKVQRWAKRKTKEISVLKANEKYRKEFLGNVSHELKTPIFNIQGYILTLIDGGLHDEEINMKYLIRAEKNINRLISIVKDLETISKLESGALKLHFENFNIINQIEEVIEMHEMLAKDHRIQLFFNQKPKGKLLVRADKKRIFEVISNLIINSILY